NNNNNNNNNNNINNIKAAYLLAKSGWIGFNKDKTSTTNAVNGTHVSSSSTFSTAFERMKKAVFKNYSTSESEDLLNEPPVICVTPENLSQFVGPRRFTSDRTYEDDNTTPPGVVTGLAYNNYGGSTNYIETVIYRHEQGKGGSLKCTGQLGKVMSESVDIAYVLARSTLYEVDKHNEFFNDHHIHLHSPEGAISKDGPSAGITITTALLSLALHKKISPNIAMTGEVTLTGKILKIGGIKEKLLAAKRAHIDTLIFPAQNKDEFFDDKTIPEYLRKEFKQVHFVQHYNDVVDILFRNHNVHTHAHSLDHSIAATND
ncbi:mitochondrial lon peptidase 1-like protein, partial [Reticulomyxa filosa]